MDDKYLACWRRDHLRVMVEMELKKELYILQIQEGRKVVGVHSVVPPFRDLG